MVQEKPSPCNSWVKAVVGRMFGVAKLGIMRWLVMCVIRRVCFCSNGGSKVNNDICMPYSGIPEGCVLFRPRNAHFCILSDRFLQFRTLCIWSLTKLLWIRLKSPFSYIYRAIIYVHAIHHRQILNFSKLFRLEDGKKCQKPGKPFWVSLILPRMSGFYIFFSFHALQNVGKVHSVS